MLKEFLDAIYGHAQQALRPHVLGVPGQVPHKVTVSMPDGSLHEIETDPPYENHKVFDLANLLDVARLAHQGAAGAVVWYARAGVVCLFGPGQRHKTTLTLGPSPQMTKLVWLESSKPACEQKALLQLLRIDFNRCLDLAGPIVDVLRKLKFRQAQAGEAVIEHGKSSLGRSIQSQLTGEGSIPEEIVLDVPVFVSGFSCRCAVRCALEIDSTAEKFWLIPYPLEVETAYRCAEKAIGEALAEGLAEAGVPVFYGQP